MLDSSCIMSGTVSDGFAEGKCRKCKTACVEAWLDFSMDSDCVSKELEWL